MKPIIRVQMQKHNFPLTRHISQLRNPDGSVAQATVTTIRKPVCTLGSSPRAGFSGSRSKTRPSARVLPQLFQPMAERLGLFGKQTHGDAGGALRELRRALGASRGEARAPMRQRLVRSGEPLEHFEVLGAGGAGAPPGGVCGST